MKKMFLALFLVFLLGVSGLSVAVNAYSSPYGQLLRFDSIELNGRDMELGYASDQSTILEEIKNGEDLDLSVWVEAEGFDSSDLTGVRVWARLQTDEETVFEESDTFNLDEGGRRRVDLNIEVPSDVDPSGEYKLVVKASGRGRRAYGDATVSDEITQEYTLKLNPQKHNLVIDDVTFNPGEVVKAGQALFTSVRLENLGDTEVDDAKVTVRVSELGIIQTAFAEDLVTEAQDKQRFEDESNTDIVEVPALIIPSNAARGDYTLTVDVSYDDGDENVREIFSIHVVPEGNTPINPPVLSNDEVRIVADVTTQALGQGGSGQAYEITFVNMGADDKVIELEVLGEENFGSARADPSVINVEAGEVETAIIYAQADLDVRSGNYDFVVQVNSDGNTIGHVNLRAAVGGKVSTPNLPGDDGEDSDLSKILIIVFGVLLALIVIIGIVVALRREPEDHAQIEEPSVPGDNKEYY